MFFDPRKVSRLLCASKSPSLWPSLKLPCGNSAAHVLHLVFDGVYVVQVWTPMYVVQMSLIEAIWFQ